MKRVALMNKRVHAQHAHPVCPFGAGRRKQRAAAGAQRCAHCKSGVKMNINRKGKNALTNRSSRTVKSVVGFAKGAKPTPLLPAR